MHKGLYVSVWHFGLVSCLIVTENFAEVHRCFQNFQICSDLSKESRESKIGELKVIKVITKLHLF